MSELRIVGICKRRHGTNRLHTGERRSWDAQTGKKAHGLRQSWIDSWILLSRSGLGQHR